MSKNYVTPHFADKNSKTLAPMAAKEQECPSTVKLCMLKTRNLKLQLIFH
jgi:hypothetical protein